VAQLVEHHLAKVGVAGSNPVVRSKNQAFDLQKRAVSDPSPQVLSHERKTNETSDGNGLRLAHSL
jgi:hypothetical protein